jgi:serine protease AprX
MNRYTTTLLLILITNLSILSQNKYWVFLNDKKNIEYDYHAYLDQKAIDRRLKINYSLNDFTDLPVNKDYVKDLNQYVIEITGKSRWFNAIACFIDYDQLSTIEDLPYVKEIQKMHYHQVLTSYDSISIGEKNLLKGQLESLEGDLFTQKDITGKGVRICVIDGGFKKANISKSLEHLYTNNQIIKTWNFNGNNSNVYTSISHGTTVLSCIAGKHNNKLMGLAQDAEFLLAKTEKLMVENKSEEEDWLMAVEWADANGAHIINSSLGYTSDEYFKEQMDGKTSIIARAANLAAKKGILVLISAGNSGTSKWKYIATPADADSVFTVGALNPWTGIHTKFSSYGPTSDKRLKPNAVAFGHVMGYSYKNGIHETQGTSFSCPILAGFAACVMQYKPKMTNMEVFSELEKSGHLHPYFDYAHGYGLPKASYFLFEKPVSSSTFDVIEDENSISIKIKDDYFSPTHHFSRKTHENSLDNTLKSFHIKNSSYSSRLTNINDSSGEVFYFHVENSDGYLDQYEVLAVNKKEILSISKSDYKNKILRFYYKNYLYEKEL